MMMVMTWPVTKRDEYDDDDDDDDDVFFLLPRFALLRFATLGGVDMYNTCAIWRGFPIQHTCKMGDK